MTYTERRIRRLAIEEYVVIHNITYIDVLTCHAPVKSFECLNCLPQTFFGTEHLLSSQCASHPYRILTKNSDGRVHVDIEFVAH
jgi:hypothetical protein